MYIYMIGPIDWWGGWTHVDNIGPQQMDETDLRGGVEENLIRAKKLARLVGWEGDIREGPFIAGIPIDLNYDDHYLIAWKQDNNGTTFVASPVLLPHLGEPSCALCGTEVEHG